MRRAYYALFAVFALLYSDNNAQTVFNRTYDYDSTDGVGFTILQTFDKGYIVGAYVSSPYFGLHLVKIDEKGDTQWTKIYDLSIGGDQASGIIQLNDSSYILCGTTQDTLGTKPDAFLFKITQNGDSLWLRRYGGTANDYGDGVQQTPDGGFLILGSTYSYTYGGMDAMVIKTDSLGNQGWLTHYGDSNDDIPEAGSLIKVEDGGYVFTGTKGMLGNSGMWLVKLDSNGNKLWDSTYSMFGDDDGANGIAQTLDGGFILVGYTYRIADDEYDGYIVKADNNGNMEWQKKYVDGDNDNTFITVVPLPDNAYVVAGNPGFSNTSGEEGSLIKITPQGDEVWKKYYSKYGSNNNDYVYDMLQARDGGFVLCGQALGGGLVKDDMWLVKTDCMGNIDKWDSVNCPLNVGAKEIEVENFNVEVYPNPFSESVTIRIMNNEQGITNYEMEIYDVLGREVKNISFIPFSKEEFTFQRDGLPDGVYFYLIKENHSIMATGKLVVSDQ